MKPVLGLIGEWESIIPSPLGGRGSG